MVIAFEDILLVYMNGTIYAVHLISLRFCMCLKRKFKLCNRFPYKELTTPIIKCIIG